MCAAEEKTQSSVKECKEELGIGKAILNKSKPIVLSSQRYNKITNNAFKSDKIKAQQKAEEEHNHREYLKAGNDQLVAHFKGNMQRTQEKKMQEMKEQMEKREQQGKLIINFRFKSPLMSGKASKQAIEKYVAYEALKFDFSGRRRNLIRFLFIFPSLYIKKFDIWLKKNFKFYEKFQSVRIFGKK